MSFVLYRSTSKKTKVIRCILECILPCLIAFVVFQWFTYCISSLIVESGHIKGINCSSSIDRGIPLASWLVLFYTPSVITWAIMPFVIYSVYGRKHFYKYFTAQLVFSLICFLIYIIAPTQAKLQHDEVVVNKIYESKNFFDKMVFKTYQSAAPYGEIPSGHWGNQLLILFALINIRDNNHRKCKITLLSIWAVFSIFVCLATMMLKQHNWIDGPITFAICLLIWVTVTYWKWSTKVEFGFRWLNIKLGIEQPNEQTQTINNNRTFITLWCLYGVVLFYLIIVLWNSTVGAFLDAKIPYLVPTYPSSYTSEGVPFVNDSWKAFW